jgi:hypothetical protein
MTFKRRTLQYVPLSAIAFAIKDDAELAFDGETLFRLISSEFDNPDNHGGVVTSVREVLDALCELKADELEYELDLDSEECEHLVASFHVISERFTDDYTTTIVSENGE